MASRSLPPSSSTPASSDRPYTRYETTAARGITYSYHLTAVDAGNESPTSNSRSNMLTDGEAPLTPPAIWAAQTPGNLDFPGSAYTAWDIAGFDVYRKAAGDCTFSRCSRAHGGRGGLLPSPTPPRQGLPTTTTSRVLTSSAIFPYLATLSVLSATGVTHVDVWKLAFEAGESWDSKNPQMTVTTTRTAS